MTDELVVIVGCGKAKRPYPAPAAELYTGPYPKTAIRWARSVEARLLILSAKYGLVPGDQVIAPYEASFSQRGYAASSEPGEPAVAWEVTSEQVKALGLGGAVILLGGVDYYRHIRRAAPHLSPHNPFLRLLDAQGLDHRTGYQSREMIRWMGRVP